MSRSSQHKEKHGKSSEILKDYYHEGTAARTRPLSFDEIMSQRKDKKKLLDSERDLVADDVLGDGSTEKFSERGNGHSRDDNIEKVPERGYGQSKDGNTQKVSERGNAWCKDDNNRKISERGNGRSKDDNTEKVSEKGNERSKYDNTKKVSERGNGRSKDGNTKKVAERGSVWSKHANAEKFSESGNGRSKDSSSLVQKHLLDRDAKASSKKKEEYTSMKDDYLTRSKDREIHDSETKLKAKMDRDLNAKRKTKEKIHERGKTDERQTNNAKIEATKKYSRHLTERDRHADGNSENFERENKRKYQNEVDEKDRDRYSTRKHDLGKGHNSETLDRYEKKESSKSRYDGLKLNNRRSRSQERVDRTRRSISPLPRSQKRASYHDREHREQFSHTPKEKSGKEHSDTDRSKITNNGSSGHYKRHSGSTRRLGGYSPRKRRTEAAARTPSPTRHSLEKKRAKWDLAPEKTGNTSSVPVLPNFQLSIQSAPLNTHETISLGSSTTKPFSEVSSSILSTNKYYSIDSVQLTQATRPMRRLYVDNIPAATSEKTVMEWLNNLLISTSLNYIKGTQPCISCITHKEKNQALVEFLTPEDASAALSFDGTSFFGSTIKIRRPRDFVEMTTGELEKSVAAINSISNVVRDSPQKIFIGGISKALSSEMIMEIAHSFGPLKAYHFENSDDRSGPCAFVEYADQSVASKACAGLNGMKLGGQVISVVQLVPNVSTLESNGYGIPELARPLLNKPMQVLKLKNVFDPESFPSLSNIEIEQVLEDVRLECTRFGTIRSVNVVKYCSTPFPAVEAWEANEDMESSGIQQNLLGDGTNAETETMEDLDHKPVEGNDVEDDKPAHDDLMNDESCQSGQIDGNMAVANLSGQNIPESQEVAEHTSKDESDCTHSKVTNYIDTKDRSMEDKLAVEGELNLEEVSGKCKEAFADDHIMVSDATEKRKHNEQNFGEELNLEEASGKSNEAFAADHGIGSDANGKRDHKEQNCDLDHIFESGCVFVEFGRTEASCTAAHCLHGRLFDNRTVTVEYIPLDVYRSRFPK